MGDDSGQFETTALYEKRKEEKILHNSTLHMKTKRLSDLSATFDFQRWVVVLILGSV